MSPSHPRPPEDLVQPVAESPHTRGASEKDVQRIHVNAVKFRLVTRLFGVVFTINHSERERVTSTLPFHIYPPSSILMHTRNDSTLQSHAHVIREYHVSCEYPPNNCPVAERDQLSSITRHRSDAQRIRNSSRRRLPGLRWRDIYPGVNPQL